MRFQSLSHIESLAIVGATGLVGRELLELLSEHRIRIPKVMLLASSESEGQTLPVNEREVAVDTLDADTFKGVEVAFFSVPGEITRRFVPIAMESGAIVVDDSSVYRMHPEVPLVVPQVNGAALREFHGKVISTPNCSTTPIALCLKPLLDNFGIERVVVSTYQSVSGAGTAAFEELSSQTISLMNGQEVEPQAFAHRIAFNCLPLIGKVTENGNSDEEEKVIRELAKILDVPELSVSATTVRVPTFTSHGASVNVELTKNFGSIEAIRELFDGFPGLKVLDKPESNIYPTNEQATGSDLTMVGRIRKDASIPNGLNFWVMTDNLRKGAALNALEILETLYNYRRMA